VSDHVHEMKKCSHCGEMYHGPVCYSEQCLRMCDATYAARCTLEAGHSGKHIDWTGYTWT